MSYDVVAKFKLQDQMTDKIRNIGRETDRANRQVASLSRTTSGLGTSFGKTAMSIVSGGHAIVGAIGGIAVAYGAMKVMSSALKLASDAEQANIAFTTMLGSAEKATSFLTKLSDFANATPFELPALRDSAKKMLAFGFAADSVIPMLTGVGNAAAGLGLGADGVDRITLALGQMKAKAKVSGDEMMQLTEAGIPAWQILADKMKTSTANVMTMSEKGLIPADKAITALVDGMNKRFPDMMDKQSKSLAGLWSTMKDTFNNKLLVKWGEGIAAALKPRFDQLVTWINANGDTINRWGANIAKVAQAGADAIASKFEKAFNYVKTHYLDNPAFNSIKDTTGKVSFVIDDLLSTFNAWFDAKGNKMLESATESIVNAASRSLLDNAPKLMEPAIKLGLTLAEGLAQGLKDGIADHPILATIIGGAVGGVPGALIGLTSSVGSRLAGGGAKEREQTKQADDKIAKIANSPEMLAYFGAPIDKSKLDKTPSALRGDGGAIFRTKPPGHAGGLDRVPYNGYVMSAHKDERVQTKAEADAYRSNRGSFNGGGVLVTGNTFNVRQESDIDAIAMALAKQVHQAQEAGAYAG